MKKNLYTQYLYDIGKVKNVPYYITGPGRVDRRLNKYSVWYPDEK